jgi:DNA-binding response OmpR family regulator
MTLQRHILVVDDDSDLRTALRRPLVAEGYQVTEAASSAEAARAITGRACGFHVIILDLALPDGDGRDLCAALRRQGISVPIILLTGMGDEHDVVRGLDAGANDYVIKPFRMSELLARVRAQLRMHDISEDAELAIGPFRFRPADRLLIEPDGHRVRLTAKEAAVLKYLYRAGGPVSRVELMEQVWGYHASATTHTVETHIYRLRLKLEPDPAGMRLLQSQDGGYRLYPKGISGRNGVSSPAAPGGGIRALVAAGGGEAAQP